MFVRSADESAFLCGRWSAEGNGPFNKRPLRYCLMTVSCCSTLGMEQYCTSSFQVKRPYFHVKPLERDQLKNWHDYLDFEIKEKKRKRIFALFERCMIACAQYEEMWIKVSGSGKFSTCFPGNC